MIEVQDRKGRIYRVNKLWENKIAIFEVNNIFTDYIEGFCDKDRDKILRILNLILQGGKIPEIYFKKLTGHLYIWEIRVQIRGKAHRYYCCYKLLEGLIIIVKIIGSSKGSGKKSKKGLRVDEELTINAICCDIYQEVSNGWKAGRFT